METEEYTIRKLAEEWAEAFKAQDSGRLLDMVTEDVVFLPPGFPRSPIAVSARAELEGTARHKPILFANGFRPSPSRWPGHHHFQESRNRPGRQNFASHAHCGGTDCPPIEMLGKGMSILKRQPDGTWRFARAINNAAMRRPAATA